MLGSMCRWRAPLTTGPPGSSCSAAVGSSPSSSCCRLGCIRYECAPRPSTLQRVRDAAGVPGAAAEAIRVEALERTPQCGQQQLRHVDTSKGKCLTELTGLSCCSGAVPPPCVARWDVYCHVLRCWLQYKFIVDGEWKHDPNQRAMRDENGNVNNVIEVQEYVPENLENISGFDPPPSPSARCAAGPSWALLGTLLHMSGCVQGAVHSAGRGTWKDCLAVCC